jgi:anti-sigma factor RsiW
MTRHVSEDALLKLVLAQLDTQSERRVRRHLATCGRCRGTLEEVERTVELIKDVRPEVTPDFPPLRGVRRAHFGWLRVAAVLVVGFGLGILASESLRPPSVLVVRQQLVPRTPLLTEGVFVICDGIDLSGGRDHREPARIP